MMEAFRYFGVLAIAILVVGLVLLVWRWPLGLHATFSQHAAARRSTIIYYNLLFTIVLSLLMLFFIGWFAPKFGLSSLFVGCMAVSAAAQYAATVIPEVGGWKTHWHRAITAVSALLLLPVTFLILLSPSLGSVAKTVVAIGLAVMLGITLFVSVVKDKQRFALPLQVGYYAAFFIPLLFVAYAGI